MNEQEKQLETMRRNLRRIAPQLAREGWTEAEVAEVSELVRGHLAAGNLVGLKAVAKWLDDRAWALLEQERKAWAASRAKEKVVAFGTEQEAETRATNRAWVRQRSN